MKKTRKECNLSETCGVDYAFKRIGGKYKGRIIWHISLNEKLRYGELKRILGDVTTKMLTQSLRELEEDKLINRKIFKQVPPKVEYTLTENGKKLIPFISHLRDWACDMMFEEMQGNQIGTKNSIL